MRPRTALAVCYDRGGVTVSMAQTKGSVQEDVVDNTIIRKVCEALSDARWDFRTIEGIARESELPVDQVQHVLDERKDVFRRSYLTHDGAPLYALRDKRETLRERLAEVRNFLAAPLTYHR